MAKTVKGREYGAHVEKEVIRVKEALLAVFQLSLQKTVNLLRLTVNEGGRLPIRTGNLRRSLLVSAIAMPTVGAPGSEYAGTESSLVIMGAKIGDTVYVGFQANYARRLEFGFVGTDSAGRTYAQAGRGFVQYAIDQWPALVAESILEVRAAMGL